jgi:Gram-negative bacterial tonB protein.
MDIVPNRIYREMREQGFEAAALEAVRRSKFLPGEKAGQPIEMPLLVPVRFDP